MHNPFGYCGEYTDSESGLIYLRNRYYSPDIARFVTEDPVKDGVNWYVYCGNNPVMFVDPLGLVVTNWDRENLSESELNQIIKNDQTWNNGTESEKSQAQKSSYSIRSKKLKPNQQLLDNGYVQETIKENVIATTSITATRIELNVEYTRTYTEKHNYISLTNVQVRVKTVSGFSIKSMSIYSGQNGVLSNRNVETAETRSKLYSFSPQWGSVIDDGGVYTIIGTNVKIAIGGRGNKVYNSTVFNQLYNKEIIDENGNIISNSDSFDILHETLMRGERQ